MMGVDLFNLEATLAADSLAEVDKLVVVQDNPVAAVVVVDNQQLGHRQVVQCVGE